MHFEELYNKSDIGTKSFDTFNYNMDKYFAEECGKMHSEKACQQTWAYWRYLNETEPDSPTFKENEAEIAARFEDCHANLE